MRRLPFLLRPGWIVLALAVVAFAYLCFTVLAPWQLGKHSRTSQENRQIESSLNTAPVPLKTLLPQQNSTASDAQWRQHLKCRLRVDHPQPGQYLHVRQIV
ncbi:SURF1 family cytochrome oxidase biogenesis protein, partial [Mycobacterium sp. 1165178.9]|uniref:SURF1 family cytochrome oxidase biogenesis protein n=1 Tax=Mycobacterium sp. 1165178.9 TaxID=1834070 RepID=UPI00350F9880